MNAVVPALKKLMGWEEADVVPGKDEDALSSLWDDDAGKSLLAVLWEHRVTSDLQPPSWMRGCIMALTSDWQGHPKPLLPPFFVNPPHLSHQLDSLRAIRDSPCTPSISSQSAAPIHSTSKLHFEPGYCRPGACVFRIH